MEIRKLLEAIEEKDMSVKDVDIKDIIPNVIGEVVINVNEKNEGVLFIPSGMSGEKMKHWMKNKGGVLYKDLKKSINNQPHGNYVILKDSESKYIARLIDDNELEAFSHLKLVDGKIKDKPFMKLRTISGEKLTESNRYIEQIYDEEMSPTIIITNHIPSEEDEDSDSQENTGSVSLFND